VLAVGEYSDRTAFLITYLTGTSLCDDNGVELQFGDNAISNSLREQLEYGICEE